MKMSRIVLFFLSFVFGMDAYAQNDGMAEHALLTDYFYLESFQEVELKKSFSLKEYDFPSNLSAGNRFMAIIFSSGPSSICPGQSVLLSSNGQGWCSYAWSTGQTTPSITITQPGTYGLTLNCSKGSNVTTYVANPITIGSHTLNTDLNVNGVVDVLDYIIFLSQYFAPCSSCPQDFNGDGFVDTRDYLIWVADIFKICN
jgi:hypothetical protein